MLDASLLSRIQFVFSVGFHILFPTLNLGLALFLVVVEGLYLYTHHSKWLAIAKFWTKIFALTFGMGVVSGLVMAYQLGTNFGGFIATFGSVLGPLFSYEVLSAFFLEAGFLGIMLFGWNKVKPNVHFAATVLVWLGTTISAFWIVSANSWMQTPSGYLLSGNKVIPDSFWSIIFNPSFMPRYVHMLFSSYITTSLVLLGVSAFHLKNTINPLLSRLTFNVGLTMLVISAPLQIVIGDMVGLKLHAYQPMKIAAMEGLWHTRKGVPLLLFAVPDIVNEKNNYQVAIPKLASFINTHQWEGKMEGLTEVPKALRPNISVVFYGFRLMVGLGFFFMMLALYTLYQRLKGSLFTKRWLLNVFIFSAPLGFIASLAGWFVAETGRQPWIVYGILKTKEAVSAVSAQQVMLSLGFFITAYSIVFAYYLYYLFKLIYTGPTKEVEDINPPTYTYLTDDVHQSNQGRNEHA